MHTSSPEKSLHLQSQYTEADIELAYDEVKCAFTQLDSITGWTGTIIHGKNLTEEVNESIHTTFQKVFKPIVKGDLL